MSRQFYPLSLIDWEHVEWPHGSDQSSAPPNQTPANGLPTHTFSPISSKAEDECTPKLVERSNVRHRRYCTCTNGIGTTSCVHLDEIGPIPFLRRLSDLQQGEEPVFAPDTAI